MRRNGWLASLSLALALGTAAVSPAVAQQDGGGRGGQPGRGPGGFGGGMMMMGGGGGGGPTALLNMLRSESVQRELELSDEEKESLTKLGETAREKMRPQGAGGGAGGFPNFGEMSEEERTKMMEDMRKRGEEVGQMVQEELETILRPSKLSRLLGIYIQNSRLQQVLTNSMIVAELGLTDADKSKIEAIGREAGEEMRGMFSNMQQGGDREEMRARMEEMRTKMEEMSKKLDEKFLATLSDEQKKKLEELKGAEFKIPAEELRGRAFGGPGAGGGRQRRGGGGGID